MYADDTLLINSEKTLQESIINSQRSLNIVANRCDLNKMSINIVKTKFMVISPTNINHNIPPELYIKDIKLSRIHVYEYLGVHIDDKLTMGSHIEKTCTSVQKKYGILRKICDPTRDLVPLGGNVYFSVDELDFHVVKTICKYSFQNLRYASLKLPVLPDLKTP